MFDLAPSYWHTLCIRELHWAIVHSFTSFLTSSSFLSGSLWALSFLHLVWFLQYSLACQHQYHFVHSFTSFSLPQRFYRDTLTNIVPPPRMTSSFYYRRRHHHRRQFGHSFTSRQIFFTGFIIINSVFFILHLSFHLLFVETWVHIILHLRYRSSFGV